MTGCDGRAGTLPFGVRRKLKNDSAVFPTNFELSRGVERTSVSQRQDLGVMADEKTELSGSDLLRSSSLYREFQAEREEILKHKWIESEKAGHDIGFERALTDWIIRHRSKWRKERQAAVSHAAS